MNRQLGLHRGGEAATGRLAGSLTWGVPFQRTVLGQLSPPSPASAVVPSNGARGLVGRHGPAAPSTMVLSNSESS